MAVATIVGGWRNHADLERLAPALTKQGLVGSRIMMSSRQSRVHVCSTLGYNPTDAQPGAALIQATAPKRNIWNFIARRPSAFSNHYGELLQPSPYSTYAPFYLDDPNLRQGVHHTVLRLESYQVSIIPWVRPRRLKEELNDQFRDSHPEIHPALTLSKLRNLKNELLELVNNIEKLDVITVAIGWVYFEKLVLKDRVRKANRKLIAGACLILAYKFHQEEPGEEESNLSIVKDLAAAIKKLDRSDRLDISSLMAAEFMAFVWLEFGLHLDRREVWPHVKRFYEHLGDDKLKLDSREDLLGEQERSAEDDLPMPLLSGQEMSARSLVVNVSSQRSTR
jgi:hypothetical protein